MVTALSQAGIMSEKPMHIISLGAGVQSSTIALMAIHGEITPMPDAAIFADTQSEPKSVYIWLDWLENRLDFPIYRISKGSLEEVSVKVRTSRNNNKYTNGNIPAFIMQPGKAKPGIMQRQCTGDFKINMIERKIREIRERRPVIQWIGISRDEAHRMKPSQKKYITTRWPLIELGMTRNDCLDWMDKNGYPEPPRSSCVFCPFHSDMEWRRLKANEPDEFKRAAQYEINLQIATEQTRLTGTPFLHRSCVPLADINFDAEDDQPSLFGNECEGVCGV